ncbi:MAG: hypothetical protein Q6361_08715 [Candidatus Hermodarchaeota archaeon]|nr:hypothetical protein [Candidatus Hermodarchaeota archaeon]
MAKVPTLDVICIGFMLVVILTAAGFWAIGYGWSWLVVAAIIIGSVFVILLTSRKRAE